MAHKKKYFFIAITLLPLLYFLSIYVSPAEQHNVLNEILHDTGMTQFRICVITNPVDISEENLKDFSIFDRPSVYIQQLVPSSTLDKELINGINLVDNCEVESGFIYKVSLPIVSSDGNLALIKITEECNCMLGGYGGEFLFRKVNGKWAKVNSYNNWIS